MSQWFAAAGSRRNPARIRLAGVSSAGHLAPGPCPESIVSSAFCFSFPIPGTVVLSSSVLVDFEGRKKGSKGVLSFPPGQAGQKKALSIAFFCPAAADTAPNGTTGATKETCAGRKAQPRRGFRPPEARNGRGKRARTQPKAPVRSTADARSPKICSNFVLRRF